MSANVATSRRGHGGKENEPRRIQSIEVGFRVLRAIVSSDRPMRLRDIAAAAEMPTSKAHLYLVSFVREGLIEQDPISQHYSMGRFAVRLGLAALGRMSLTELARDELPLLRDATGCGAYISIWGNRGPTVAIAVDGPSQGSLAIRTGYVLAPTKSATGRVFLAHLRPSDLAEAVEQLSLSDSPTLQEEIERARKAGYSLALGSPLNPGFFAMAAPIFDFSKAIAATLTIIGSKMVLEQKGESVLAAPLVAAARRISNAEPPAMA